MPPFWVHGESPTPGKWHPTADRERSGAQRLGASGRCRVGHSLSGEAVPTSPLWLCPRSWASPVSAVDDVAGSGHGCARRASRFSATRRPISSLCPWPCILRPLPTPGLWKRSSRRRGACKVASVQGGEDRPARIRSVPRAARGLGRDFVGLGVSGIQSENRHSPPPAPKPGRATGFFHRQLSSKLGLGRPPSPASRLGCPAGTGSLP